MTGTPGASGATGPVSVTVTEYGIKWTVSNGSIPATGASGITNAWPTSGTFNTVNFGNDDDFVKQIKNQFVSAQVVSRTKTTTTGASGASGVTGATRAVVYGPPVSIPYELTSYTVTSSHESNNKWVFPDDFNADVDPNYPKQYGGVVLFEDYTPGSYLAGQEVEAGADKDGEFTYTNEQGDKQTVISGYNYFDCFEKGEYKFTPRNSSAMKITGSFDARKYTIPSRPIYPNLKDENGKFAPIYPIDSINSFNSGDSQQSVTVTYTFKMTASAQTTVGLPATLQNPTLTMTQTVSQPSNMSDRIQKILDICNFTNPQNISVDNLAPGYTVDYPYTLVSGYYDVPSSNPTQRGSDIDLYGSEVGRTLQRGDVWYNPAKDERKYWRGKDIVDSVKVIKKGTNYITRKNVNAFTTMDVSPEDLVDQEMRLPLPYGLVVDIVANDEGEVTSATVVEGGYNFENGDIVAVSGGNGNARLEIIINDTNRWTSKYVPRN